METIHYKSRQYYQSIAKIFIEFIFVIAFFIFIPNDARADYHLVYEIERNYMGYKHSYSWEFWISDTAIYFKSPNSVKVFTRDLNICTEMYRDSTFYIDDISNSMENDSKLDFTILGFQKYKPQYNWTTDKSGNKSIMDIECVKYTSFGDADYGKMTSEFFLGCGIDQEACTVINSILRFILRNMKTKAALINEMKCDLNLIPVYIQEKIQQPIAGNLHYIYTLTHLKDESAPTGIYQVPKGFKEMN